MLWMTMSRFSETSLFRSAISSSYASSISIQLFTGIGSRPMVILYLFCTAQNQAPLISGEHSKPACQDSGAGCGSLIAASLVCFERHAD